MEKIRVIRAQYGAIGDELQGRMPLAYAHIVQVLVDVVLWMYPFMAYATNGMDPWLGVVGTGLLTIFHQGLFDLAKQFLDPYDRNKSTEEIMESGEEEELCEGSGEVDGFFEANADDSDVVLVVPTTTSEPMITKAAKILLATIKQQPATVNVTTISVKEDNTVVESSSEKETEQERKSLLFDVYNETLKTISPSIAAVAAAVTEIVNVN